MKIFLICTAVLFLLSCTDKKNTYEKVGKKQIKSVQAVEIVTLTNPEDGYFSHPQFSYDGAKLFFTSDGYRGIFVYDFLNKNISKINSIAGAGYNFLISPGDRFLFFRTDTITADKRRKFFIFKQDINSREIKKISGPAQRNLSLPQLLSNNRVAWFVKDILYLYDWSAQQNLDLSQQNYSVFRLRGNQLLHYSGGKKKVYQPFGEYNLLWFENLIDLEKLIVYAVGKGAFLYNNTNNQSRFLGDFRAAKYSMQNRMLVFMRDQDDGHRLTASDIYITPIDTISVINLTNTKNEIELYPAWSPDGSKIAYHTLKGEIKLLNLKF